MRLTQVELDRLTIFTAAELARRRRDAGLRLSAPEAIALICDAMLEAGRAGATYADVMDAGGRAVTVDQVMEAVPALVDEVRVEVLMDDGTRLIVLRQPLGAAAEPDEPELERSFATPHETRTLSVTNIGRHLIRVSSHYPFDRVNRRLEFDRGAASGFHLDLPAGATLRWLAGQTREVTLRRYGGHR